MFGGIAFMINDHMCCGIVKTDLMLRLSPEAVVTGLRGRHTRPMDFTGKPMNSMLFVNSEGSDSDEALHERVESALTFVLSLPAKKPAVRKLARASRSGGPT